jgi:hypothetical protein
MPAVMSYLRGLLDGETEIVVVNGNVPIAKIISMQEGQPHRPDRAPDLYPSMWVSDDFDALLPGEYWLTNQE